MRQLEIDSDKFTTLSVCGFLVLALWIAISTVMDVASGTFQSRTHSWFNYLFIIVAPCGFLSELRDGKLRQEYPYGFLAFGLFIVEFAVEMVLPGDTTGMASRVPGTLGLVASALVMFEGARWFRARVRIANPE